MQETWWLVGLVDSGGHGYQKSSDEREKSGNHRRHTTTCWVVFIFVCSPSFCIETSVYIVLYLSPAFTGAGWAISDSGTKSNQSIASKTIFKSRIEVGRLADANCDSGWFSTYLIKCFSYGLYRGSWIISNALFIVAFYFRPTSEAAGYTEILKVVDAVVKVWNDVCAIGGNILFLVE